MDEATDSNQKVNDPLRSAPNRPKQAQIRHKRHFPEAGPLHLFRLELALADLRAKSGNRILRLIAVRSFLAPTNHPQKTIHHHPSPARKRALPTQLEPF
jgi:hypothetical protein